jgi:hypothetical protein
MPALLKSVGFQWLHDNLAMEMWARGTSRRFSKMERPSNYGVPTGSQIVSSKIGFDIFHG